MAHLAAELRHGVVGAVALLAMTVAPVRVHVGPCVPTPTAAILDDLGDPSSEPPVDADPSWQLQPLTIELPEPNGIPNNFDSWEHPDMQAWPRGMVMGVPPIDRGIVLRRAVFDSWLSVLLTPLLSSGA